MRNKKVKAIRILSMVITSLLVSVHQPVFAQSNNIGMSLGIGSMHVDDAASNDETNTSWTGAIEYERRFYPSFAVKVSGHIGNASSVKTKEIGEATTSERDVDYKAISLSAVGYYVLSQNHEFYLSAGVNGNNVKMDPKSGTSTDKDGVGYTVQAGWQYHFNKRTALQVSMQRLGLEDIDINTANIGVTVSF
ncbi:porin family protein [Agarivorans gilvus]|uniref:porin family protein n=1 Tax=Agarivorans gilvus TaxID=680279 RepID=UPI0006EBFD1F|nr:porin family protein [Agarivorans gilvus]